MGISMTEKEFADGLDAYARRGQDTHKHPWRRRGVGYAISQGLMPSDADAPTDAPTHPPTHPPGGG